MQVVQWKKLETEFAASGGPDIEQEPVCGKPFSLRLSGILPYCIVLILSITLLVGLFNVWTRMALVQLGYKMSKLETRNKELKGRVRELSLELASLESPAEIEKRATKKGLSMPLVGRIINVP